jgi:hypothetical protein
MVFGFGALIVHYRGQNPFAQVTDGQFIDYQPNYASVFFGVFPRLLNSNATTERRSAPVMYERLTFAHCSRALHFARDRFGSHPAQHRIPQE